MASSAALDHTPFDIMVGTWIGLGFTYSIKGHRQSAGASRNLIYWKNRPTVMSFRQDGEIDRPEKAIAAAAREVDALKELLGDEGPAALSALAIPEYDLTISDKRGTASSATIDLSGTETTPDAYHFELKEKGTGLRLRWHNSHIFVGPNEKRIMGPILDTKATLGLIMVQIFTRVSYDVPPELQRDLP